jgi:KTSC domain
MAKNQRGRSPGSFDPSEGEEQRAKQSYRRAAVSDRDDEGYTWVIPSATSNPLRPRTHRVGYNIEDHTVRMVFRNGRTYVYGDEETPVPAAVWERIRRTASTGKFINRVLNDFPYQEEG